MNYVHDSRVNVLDHGYVEVVDVWGSDERIVEAARMSTQKGFEGWGPISICRLCGLRIERDYPHGGDDSCTRLEREHEWEEKPGDEKLLAYLWKNHHDTPFEMAGMTVEVQAPIFVFREWHRHRVPWGYNEASARYSPLPAIDYVPTPERALRGGGHLTRQASSTGATLDEEMASEFSSTLRRFYKETEELYQNFLRGGVPKELARLVLPVGRYSRMRATSNLRGWCHFLGLREAPNAQWEIQEYARACHLLLEKRFPRVIALFAEGRRGT